MIVTLEGSFHGRTLASLAATAQPAKQEAFQPLPGGFASVPLNDVEALEALFAQRGDDICAVMLECIQGESGVHPCTPEFLQAARRLTAGRGALLICDEVHAYLRARLAELEHVVEVRGFGLMLAAQLDDDCDANDIVARALGEGLLLNATGPRTLRFLPPLICGKSHVDALIERLGRLL